MTKTDDPDLQDLNLVRENLVRVYLTGGKGFRTDSLVEHEEKDTSDIKVSSSIQRRNSTKSSLRQKSMF